jgi:hypothetical protein
MNRPVLTFATLTLLSSSAHAQDDLLSLLGEDSTTVEYTTASFKATRVINSHSLENVAHGVLDFKINHRFGELSLGAVEAFGLDQATIRLGLDYGITPQLMVGIGRSSWQKEVDGFVKYKVLRQCDKGCEMPITLAVVAGMGTTTVKKEDTWWFNEGREDFYTHRLYYNLQVIVGRKFSERFTLQLMPGVIHRNLVELSEEKSDIINVGVAGRIKLTRRLAINGEYFYMLPDQGPQRLIGSGTSDTPTYNSLSIGFDIETGGHVFQLHMTNSTGMYERAVITETTGSWEEGDIHFGFNISRVFTIHDPRKAVGEKKKEDAKW